jgi:hypothetical protein
LTKKFDMIFYRNGVHKPTFSSELTNGPMKL